jgi:hypothetical protein
MIFTFHRQHFRKSHKTGLNIYSVAHLQKHSGRLEWNFHLFGRGDLPINDLLNILTLNLKLITVTNRRFEKYLNRVRKLICNTNINTTIKIVQLCINHHSLKKKKKITRIQPINCKTKIKTRHLISLVKYMMFTHKPIIFLSFIPLF